MRASDPAIALSDAAFPAPHRLARRLAAGRVRRLLASEIPSAIADRPAAALAGVDSLHVGESCRLPRVKVPIAAPDTHRLDALERDLTAAPG